MMFDAKQVQARLVKAGQSIAIDGAFGPRSWAALLSHVAQRPLGERGLELGRGFVAHCAKYGIGTPLRLAHFVGQTAHETGGYNFLREIWAPTAAQRGYEGRGDLGNNQPGDGRRFLGRGLIQITGRDNYASVGARIGIDLIAQPELAERPDVAVLTACDWWGRHGCNALADHDEGVKLGRLINRGSANATRPANGEAERIALTARAKIILL